MIPLTHKYITIHLFGGWYKFFNKKSEDTKGGNNQKLSIKWQLIQRSKEPTNNYLQNTTHKTKDWARGTTLKAGDELGVTEVMPGK